MSDTPNNHDIDAILLRLKELEAKSKELDLLKREVKDIKDLTVIGSEIADEVNKEIVAEVEALKQQDITIPFLQKKADDIIFKKRGLVGLSAKPLLESEILEVQKVTASARQAAKRLGVSYPTYKKYCKLYNIFKKYDRTAKRPNICPFNPYKGKYPITDILEGKHPNFPIHRLKDKLIRSGIKKAECEQCGYHERRITDGKIPLLLNFEDGDKHNHRLENIKIYCYNCTFNCGRGYLKKGTIHFNMDPDILQGAKCPLKSRF
jgi:hypothetical protein